MPCMHADLLKVVVLWRSPQACKSSCHLRLVWDGSETWMSPQGVLFGQICCDSMPGKAI